MAGNTQYFLPYRPLGLLIDLVRLAPLQWNVWTTFNQSVVPLESLVIELEVAGWIVLLTTPCRKHRFVIRCIQVDVLVTGVNRTGSRCWVGSLIKVM